MAGEQTGVLRLPADIGGICHGPDLEDRIVNFHCLVNVNPDIAHRADSAGSIPVKESFVTRHSQTGRRSNGVGLGIDIFQRIGVGIDYINPGILVVMTLGKNSGPMTMMASLGKAALDIQI